MIIVTAHGRLAFESELKMGQNTSWCDFRVLSTRYAGGEDHVEAVDFVVFGDDAERFCQRLVKGQLISVSGTQNTRRWTDSSGSARSTVRYVATWWEPGPKPRQGAQGDARRDADTGGQRRWEQSQSFRSRPSGASGQGTGPHEQGEPPAGPGII